MYNRLFTKILDSSIWLESSSTRIVWITLLAAMDETGYAHFSAIENLANRARISVEDTSKALECLMGPDTNSENPDNDGRRVERVPGGFMILNAGDHRKTLNREIEREQTRLRVAKHRALSNKESVTAALRGVTSASASESTCTKEGIAKGGTDGFDSFWSDYPNKQAKLAAKRAWLKIKPDEREEVMRGLAAWKRSESWLKDDGQFIPHPATFLNQRRFEDSPKQKALKKKVYYNHLPPAREVPDAEWKNVADIAKRESEKLRAKLRPAQNS